MFSICFGSRHRPRLEAEVAQVKSRQDQYFGKISAGARVEGWRIPGIYLDKDKGCFSKDPLPLRGFVTYEVLHVVS